MATLHYNRTILYLCPSILYYASTTIPTYIQNWMKHRCSDKGTRIVSVTRISCPSLQSPNAAVWDIVFEASDKAFQQYRPGQNVYLHVPHVSIVKHPFTANRVPGSQNRLRLLIRETGPFTSQLGSCLNNSLERTNSIQLATEQDMEAQSLPHASILPMYITGFHGVSCRMQQLCNHENVCIIAGGIGITPYLSLLFEMIDQHASSNVLKSLKLHWICRDISLIRHIQEQYFSKMLTRSHPSDEKPSCSLEIIVHYTGTERSPSASNTIAFSPETSSQYCAATSPMAPCYSSLGISQHVSQNVFSLMVFASIFSVGLWMVLLLFGRVQSKDAMATRMLPLISICISSVGLAIVFVHFSGENKICCKLPMSASNEVCNYSTVTENDPTSSLGTLATYKEQSTGRPDLRNLLLSLKTSRNPAVFVSGPKQLMDEVRHSAKSCNCSCEVYEELFEL
jgi:ferredoxin-NADP reductase